MSLYNAEISAGSLMIPESRKVAALMLCDPTPAEWEYAIKVDNILQKKPATAWRQARLLRRRLATLDREGLMIIVSSDAEACAQVLLAAAIRHSRLVGDFMRDVYTADLRKLEKSLSYRQWDSFLAECEHRDEAVKEWARTTREKLFQVIVRILAEAKYLDSTRRLGLTPPMLHPKARAYIQQLGDAETLSRMEVRR